MKKIIILFVIFVFLLTGISSLQAVDNKDLREKIDSVIKKSMAKNKIPGIAVSVVKGNEIFYSKGFARSAKEGKKRITASTPFYIGSLSKSFTALAIMQLVDEGKIRLDDPVKKYIPFFEMEKGDYEGNITVRHLLNHRSGLTEQEYISDLRGDATIEEGVRDLTGTKLSYAPGKKFNYFNPNYNTLGLIIEYVSDMSYEDYIKKNILIPLEMNNTYLKKDKIMDEVVQGHGAVFSFPIKREESFKKYAIPSGFIVSTAEDMGKYLLFQQNGSYKNTKLLSNKSLKAMHTAAGNKDHGYAMGWKIGEKFGYRIVEHGGSLLNYSANAVMIPEKNIGVIFLINQNHYINNIISNNQLADNILKVLLNPEIALEEINVIPLGSIFLVIAVIALLTVIKDVYQIMNIKRWKNKMQNKGKIKIYLNIASNFLIAILLIAGIPLIFKYVFNRGFAFNPAFQLMPGLASWLIVSSILNLIKGALKIVRLS